MSDPSAGASATASSATASIAQTGPAAAADDLVPLAQWNIRMVTAMNAGKGGDVAGVTDHFNINAKVFVHAAMTSKPGDQAGSHLFEMKWFEGLNVVTEQHGTYEVKGSPFYINASTPAMVLGAGAHRVELFADGKYLTSTQFMVDGN